MKQIEIEDDLYAYIAAQTQDIGENASQILRRLLLGDANASIPAAEPESTVAVSAQPNTGAVAEHREPASVGAVSGKGLKTLVDALALNKDASRVERFLMLLGVMHQDQGTKFSKVLEIKGRNRVYFGTSKAALLAAGSSTNPKQIPHSDYWVVTNNNTDKKRAMLSEVTDSLGYSESDKAYLVNVFAA